MIISRTPFRISFVGGGSDIDTFYRRHPGAVVSTTIDKYMYVTVNERFEDTIRVAYTETEIVDTVDEIQHDLIREAMKMVGIDGGVEVTTIADVPAGTGLGSSSSLTVGLLKAFYAYKGVFKKREDLAREACKIEIDVLEKPIGKQDQYAAAFGGLNFIEFHRDGSVSVNPVTSRSEVKNKLASELQLYYTGINHRSDEVLERQKKKTISGTKNVSNLKKMVGLAHEARKFLEEENYSEIGNLLHENWELKKELSEGISNSRIAEMYKLAKRAGVKGGKILGAGGRGFFLFYLDKSKRGKLRKKLEREGLRKTNFKFETEGSKIIYTD